VVEPARRFAKGSLSFFRQTAHLVQNQEFCTAGKSEAAAFSPRAPQGITRMWLTVMIFIEPPTSFIQISPLRRSMVAYLGSYKKSRQKESIP
jgi:hypothetical protein